MGYFRAVTLIETESKIMVAQGLVGREGWGAIVNRYRVPVLQKVLEMNGGDGYTTM